ncbi:NAD(+) synthase [Collinsella ureilytica]|nr:NAD(+) synthase [Collinsella urealyticum]
MDSCADGFFRIAAATPRIRVGDVLANTEAVLSSIRSAASAGVSALVLPELVLTGYTAQDLFLDRTLLEATRAALQRILAETADLPLFIAIGMPVAYEHHLYNAAAICFQGRLLGLVGKHNLPHHGEFHETRWFSEAPARPIQIRMFGQDVCLGSGLVFACTDEGAEAIRIGVEICEDLWVSNPPSNTMATCGGATVMLNLSASDELVGKQAWRRQLISSTSARLFCAYAYADAGWGESTTDLVFAGANLIAENGAILSETKLFSSDIAVADIDLVRLVSERRHSSTWAKDTTACLAEGMSQPTIIPFSFGAKAQPLRYALETNRSWSAHPFVPPTDSDLAHRCETILGIQATGLATRLAHTKTTSVLLGLSGGLDSTLALVVCARAFDLLDLDRSGIHAVSMPGFGTTSRTRTNAERLACALGVDFRVIPIGDAVSQHFADIEHDPAVVDVTFENAQARERTQILMDLANELHGLVVGTGDLSELALGWATYNADHMSMYGVNAGVPKTLVRYLVAYAARTSSTETAAILEDILSTPVSPELLPPTGEGEIAQRTEDLVGPYELHDFFLYYLVRFGERPGKIWRMACRAFADTYDPETIRTWLAVFYRRFFSQQFKRSCLPDGPKVGSVSLSPRGDWRMPSDATAQLWLDEIDQLAQEENH